MAALLALVIALAGCSVPGAPRYADNADSQDGLFRPATQTSSIALSHMQSVGVIFTENTVANLAYLERYHSAAQNSLESHLLDPEIKQAYISSSDPELAIEWLNTSLEKQFASVNFYNDLDTLMDARPDVIVLLDTHNQLVTDRTSDVQASVVAQFFDANLNYIGKAQGYSSKDMSPVWALSKRASEIAAEINEQHTVQVNALEQFDASLNSLIDAKS